MTKLDSSVLDEVSLHYSAQSSSRFAGLVVSAEMVLRDGDCLPMQASTVAYYLREAINVILMDNATSDKTPNMREALQRVKFQFDLYGIPSSPLEQDEKSTDQLIASVRELLAVDDSGSFAKRAGLKKLEQRVGTGPWFHEEIKRALDLREQANKGLHSSFSQDEAIKLWESTVRFLNRFMGLPLERKRQVVRLARMQSPSDEDLQEARDAIVSDAETTLFLTSLEDPVWLELVQQWLTVEAVCDKNWMHYLGSAFVERQGEFAAFAHRVLDQFLKSDTRVCYPIAHSLLKYGDVVESVMIRILNQNAGGPVNSIVSLWAESLPDESEAFINVFDVLVNGDRIQDHHFEKLCNKLSKGMTSTNAKKRLQITYFKLNRLTKDKGFQYFFHDPGIGILEFENVGFSSRVKVAHLAKAIVEMSLASERTIAIPEIVAAQRKVEGEIGFRIQASYAAGSQKMEAHDRVGVLAEIVQKSPPNIDGFQLIDVLSKERGDEELSKELAQLIPMPTVDDCRELDPDQMIDSGSIRFRLRQWSSILPEGSLVHWDSSFDSMGDRPVPHGREHWLEQRGVVLEQHESPIQPEELNHGPVPEVLNRIKHWQRKPNELYDTRFDVSTALAKAIEAEPDRWLDNALDNIKQLDHPIYAQGYLTGLLSLDRETIPKASTLVEVAQYLDSRSMQHDERAFEELGEATASWHTNKILSIKLLEKKSTAEEPGFENTFDLAWKLVDQESRMWTSERTVFEDEDSLHQAINRDSTKAFNAAITFMAYQYKTQSRLGKPQIQLLDDSLTQTGKDGKEYRAILVHRHQLISQIVPDWWERKLPELFGDENDELQTDTANTVFKYSPVANVLMETFPRQVQRALSDGIENTNRHVLVAMLRRLQGYTVPETVVLLFTKDSDWSKVGSNLSIITETPKKIDQEVMQVVTEFWRNVLEHPKKYQDCLTSFGRFAFNHNVPNDEWVTLTLKTVEATTGQIDFAYRTAERLNTMSPSDESLQVFIALVEAINKDFDYHGVEDGAIEHLKNSGSLKTTQTGLKLEALLKNRGHTF